MVYANTGVKFLKLYGPSIALGTLSIASILAGNHILRQRNVALAAAYVAVDKGFKQYRNRVVERFGQEVDKELRYNIKAEKFTETEIDEKTGKEKKVKKNVKVVDELEDYSVYAKVFDETSRYWEKDPEMNLVFLKNQQNYAMIFL